MLAFAQLNVHAAGQLDEAADAQLTAKYEKWKKAVTNPNDCLNVFLFFYNNPHWPLFHETVKIAETKISPQTSDSVLLKWFKRHTPKTREGLIAYIDRLLRSEPDFAIEYIRQTWILQNLAPEFLIAFRLRYKDFIRPIDDAQKAKRLVGLLNIPQLQALQQVTSDEVRAYISNFLERVANTKMRGYKRAQLVDVDSRYAIVQKLISQNKFMDAANVLTLSNTDEERHGLTFLELRRDIAYRVLRAGHPELAYSVMSQYKVDTTPKDEKVARVEWLLGYIAYRFLHEFKSAITHFEAAYNNSTNPIRLSKNAFWLAEVHNANEDILHGLEWYRKAAQHPSTFYGYIANEKAVAIGGPDVASAMLDRAAVPALTEMVFYNRELVQVLLRVPDRTMRRHFYAQLIRDIADPVEEMLILGIAIRNGEIAILISENSRRQRYFTSRDAYQVLDQPAQNYVSRVSRDPCFMALVHSVIRSESNFKANAVSHVGAQGLMQIMQATAQFEIKRLGPRFYVGASLFDVQTNISIGASILFRALRTYDNNVVYVVAAYNCGDGNLRKFKRSIQKLKNLTAFDMMELIPIKETRIYVKHVLRALFTYSKIFDSGSCYGYYPRAMLTLPVIQPVAQQHSASAAHPKTTKAHGKRRHGAS
ncbi:MAG: lytic transglycosylase domain-containing protein [Holosporales bacterium]|jgi:soluble lytic murein transglycosylase|nr:lytic transglycosylase domain-containing protein [Holosporales bacterium]